MNLAMMEIGKLFTQGMRQGTPCTLDTFLVYLGFMAQKGYFILSRANC